MKTREELIKFVKSLIAEGMAVRHGNVHPGELDVLVELEPFVEWSTSCVLLIQQLGFFGEPWKGFLGSPDLNTLTAAQTKVAALQSILTNIQAGRLVRIEELVNADTFGNLIEQGEHLLEVRYHIAAGILFRAVLEEKLRNLCDREGCMPAKAKPTIDDYNKELYRTKFYDKITMKNVDAMAAVGNAAAHNENPSPDDVRQFHNNLLVFLSKYGA